MIKTITEQIEEEELSNVNDFLIGIESNKDNGEMGFQFYLMEKVNELTNQVNVLTDQVNTLTNELNK